MANKKNQRKTSPKKLELMVDMFTYSEELNDFMHAKYPNLTDEQYDIQVEGRRELYCFYDLGWKELKPTLDKNVLGYEYEIRNSKTGDFVRINKV